MDRGLPPTQLRCVLPVNSQDQVLFSSGLGQGPATAKPQLQISALVVEVASNKMAVTHVLCFRRHFLTYLHALTAAGMELAARRRICR